MEERRVINVERDFADDREGILAILEIVDPDVLRNETAHRIDREPLDRRFDPALVQLLGDTIAPFLAKPALRQIPAGPAEDENERNNREPQEAARLGTMNLRPAPVELARERGRSGL